jgi:predicted CopG family antitoxin
MFSKLKTIAISTENYLELKSLGKAGDSFNDVITQMLKKNSTFGKLPGKVTEDQL